MNCSVHDMQSVADAWLLFTTAYAEQIQYWVHRDVRGSLLPELASALESLCLLGAAKLAAQKILHDAQADMQQIYIPKFWATLQKSAGAAGCGQPSTGSQNIPEASLYDAIQGLCSMVDAYVSLLVALGEHVLQKFPHLLGVQDRIMIWGLETVLKRSVAASLLSRPPIQIPGLLHKYYLSKLNSLQAALQKDEEEEFAQDREGGSCDAMSEEGQSVTAVMGQTWAQGLQGVSQGLRQLGLEDVSEEAYATVICGHLRERLVGCATHTNDDRILAGALEYSTAVPLQFLELVLPSGEAGASAARQWTARLSYYVYETVGSLRIADMFDIVVDYPDSLPALDDIRDCLSKTNLHSKFVSIFGNAIEARLLHPGAATTDILQQYVSTIKALQHIDSSGVLLGAVAGPIRQYLRERKDTIRCIVTMLTDDGAEDVGMLFAELGNLEQCKEDGDADFEGADADAQALMEAERWEPDPIEADPNRIGRQDESGDAIGMLVSIYGSKELFINEYRTMLADRLLAKTDYDCERELRTLELLKVRFGEANLYNAEIMLKDLADSKRINGNVHGVSNKLTPMKKRQHPVDISALSATVLSALFWPHLPQEDLKLTPEVQAMMDTYGAKYHSLKAPRKLLWKPNLGQVTLEVSIGGQFFDFQVSPFHALILLAFKDRVVWPAAELASELGVKQEALRKRAIFWLNKGVLSEVRDPQAGLTYMRNESVQKGGAAGDLDAAMEEELEHEADPQQGMRNLEPFVMGMLTNFESLPLDRIHNMLKMFVVDPPYDKSAEQLASFLGSLVMDEKITMHGGHYCKQV